MMLMGFAAREALHITAYSHLIETLGLPESTYNEFLAYQEMKDKHDYILNHSSLNGDKKSIAENVALFSAFTEGMQFDKGYIYPYFVTDSDRMETVLPIVPGCTRICHSMTRGT